MEKYFHHGLNLDQKITNIEIVRAIFIYFKAFKFQTPRSINCGVIMQKKSNTHMETHVHTFVTPSVTITQV